MKAKIIFLLIIFLPLIIFAFKINKKRINSYLTRIEDREKWSGYLLIAQNDSIIYGQGFGYADYENKIPFTASTSVCVGSTSKIFTGVMIAKLVQDGKLKFTDTIEQYFPSLPYGSKITVHHLLTHSSGLGCIDLEIPNFSYKNINSCTDLLGFLQNDTLKFIPGSDVAYSNSGMFLLGALIEIITKSNFKECIKEHIIEPLNMKNTLFINGYKVENNTRKKHEIAYYYKRSKKNFSRWKPTSKHIEFKPLSSGGMLSSAQDLFKFVSSLRNNKIINKDMVNIFFNTRVRIPTWKDHFFGYIGVHFANGAIGHGNSGVCKMQYFKKYKTTMILIQNCGDFINAFKLADRIEKIIFNNETIVEKYRY
jgi:CubicO group peptidase (beta-lactamase class C family)